MRPSAAEILKSLDTKDRIPQAISITAMSYNFWQDAAHVRGLWRRTSVADYRNAKPNWEVLLDVDKYDAEQHKNWVFHGAQCAPGMKQCLVDLSPGGGDAGEIFEYDPAEHASSPMAFISPSPSRRRDISTTTRSSSLRISVPARSTKSSYPRIVKIWHRGQALADAKTVYEAKPDDISARPVVFAGHTEPLRLIVAGSRFLRRNTMSSCPTTRR